MKPGSFWRMLLDEGMKQADQVDRDEGDLGLAMGQDDGAGHERIVDARGLAVLAEAGDVDRLVADLGSDVGFGEAGLYGELHPAGWLLNANGRAKQAAATQKANRFMDFSRHV